MPNQFTSPTSIPYLNIHKRWVGYINTTTKTFYLSDSFDRSSTSEECNKQQDALFSFINNQEPAFDPSNWKAFGIYYLMSDDEYTLDFKESVTADLCSWAREVENRLYGMYTGAFDKITQPENIVAVALTTKMYGFGNVFNHFANKAGNETNSTLTLQETSEKKFGR